MYIDEKHTVFVFLSVFMTMTHSDIDYNGKIMLKLSSFCNFWCRQPDFPIDLRVFQFSLATHSNRLLTGFFAASFCKISVKLFHIWTQIELFCLETVIKIVLEVQQDVQPHYWDVFKL